MEIGVPREIKEQEYRVAVTPVGVEMLTRAGHRVWVESEAGRGSGFSDEAYARAGATLVPVATVWERAELIAKVKEPLPAEFARLRPGQILFTYLHLAANEAATRVLLERQVTAIAYETIALADGSLPLLAPMSEIAGRMSVQVAAHYLERPVGGRGKLLGGVPGVYPARVVILGAGTVGLNAAQIALGMGAQVTLMDVRLDRLRWAAQHLPGALTTVFSTHGTLATAVAGAEVVIGAVLVPSERAPRLVTAEMVASMEPGSVIVDVAIDQGGCVATSQLTSHVQPVVSVHGVLHYGVPNMPGAVPRTATYALSNATLPYLLSLASRGLVAAVGADPALAGGVNTYRGHLTCAGVGKAFGWPVTDLATLLPAAGLGDEQGASDGARVDSLV